MKSKNEILRKETLVSSKPKEIKNQTQNPQKPAGKLGSDGHDREKDRLKVWSGTRFSRRRGVLFHLRFSQRLSQSLVIQKLKSCEKRQNFRQTQKNPKPNTKPPEACWQTGFRLLKQIDRQRAFVRGENYLFAVVDFMFLEN